MGSVVKYDPGVGRIGGSSRGMKLTSSELRRRADELRRLLSPCRLCPNVCEIDRLAGDVGRCGIGVTARVASWGPHFGEEAPLVGRLGSGTVFFSGCSLSCCFCQNWEISQEREGTDATAYELSQLFLHVQAVGCHNLNLVTPTHQAHAIIEAIAMASMRGFDVPVLWNCGGYESLETLRLLDGIVSIYMPDVKYGDDAAAGRLSGVSGYVAASQSALREMHRQVGDLVIDQDGVARRGLLVRHLVLPEGLAGTEAVVRFLAQEISPATYVNLMDQYRPCYRAHESPELSRPTSRADHDRALALARRAGLHRFA
jgi:putative pyruvate formate lyase activating enzyme